MGYHCLKGFEAIGEEARIWKFSSISSKNPRVFQDTIPYWNIRPEEFIDRIGSDPVYIFEPKHDGGSKIEYFDLGLQLYISGRAWIYLNDIFDIRDEHLLKAVLERKGDMAITARPTLVEMTGAQYKPMPYFRKSRQRKPYHPRKTACFAPRISNEKRFVFALAANRYLQGKDRIEFIGQANSLHLYHTKSKYPEAEALMRNKGFRMGQGVDRIGEYHFSVDMTRYKDEKDFTQYITLESMEAGSVPVVDKFTCGNTPLGQSGACFLCDTPVDIASAVLTELTDTEINRYWQYYDDILQTHSAQKFAADFLEMAV